MTQPSIDSQINRDLSSLADESRRGLGDFAEVSAIIDDRRSAYRDERPGLEARRDALVKRRHLELALMPLSLERMFVHRISRAAAGGVGALCAVALLVGISQPILVQLAESMIPGRVTFVLAGLAVAIAILCSYVVAGWVAERVFERRMRESVASSDDAMGDLDALARGPIDHARALVRQVDAWAIGLPLVAVATLAPLWAFFSIAALTVRMPPFDTLAFVSRITSGTDLALLALGMAVGVALAIAAGRACSRENRSLFKPWLLAALEHVIALPLAVVAWLALMALFGVTLGTLHHGGHVTEGTRLLLAGAGTLSVVAPAAWALLWYRRREQRRLEA